jgi:NAD+ synthase (glutamine-hydrolysing)
VGGTALNQTPLDWDGNRDRIITAIQTAREHEVAILCLPELCITGYGCEDAFQSPGVQRMAWRVLEEIEPHTAGIVVAVGLPVRFESGVYDAVAVLADGRLMGIVCKQHLAGEGIHYEPRWFRPWPKGRRSHLVVEGRRVPIGDLRFDCGGVRVGFEICEDAWAAERPGASLAARGVDLILNPSASHFAFGKDEIRRRFVLEGSRAYGVTYVYANLLGNEAGRAVYDGGVIIATTGRIAAAGRRFAFADQVITTAVVDVDATRLAQSRLSLDTVQSRDAGDGDCDGDCVSIPFTPPTLAPQRESAAGDARDAWESGSFVKEEEFARAVALGLFDYQRKSHSRGFVVSASGGADSSAVACLVALAVRLAAHEMPIEAVAARLGMARPSADGGLGGAVAGDVDASIRQLIHAVLICVYQSTAHSGSVTRTAARGLAESLGAEFHEFDVEILVQGYRAMVAEAVGRPLDWQTDDVALQNIQARARAPGVWMLANIRGALLVSTSNRSEAAVGYATMDGDTSGGIAPIAGIDKAYLRRWLDWLQRSGPDGIGAFPALAAVNVQAPTAELRPPSDHQTDEADLMPYDVLDAAERCAIRDKQTPLETWQRLQVTFPAHSARQLECAGKRRIAAE